MNSLPRTPRASVVIVSFNSEDTLPAAVASVDPDLEVVVVEQSVGGHAAEAVRAVRPDAVVVNAGSNRGFGAGCNLGAANAAGDTLIFLNPDAALAPGASSVLIDRALAGNGSLVGPAIQDGDGHLHTDARRFSHPVRDSLHLLIPPVWIPRPLKQSIPPDDRRYLDGGPVPYVQGACFAVRRDLYFAVGGCDERFFLYGEEEHLSRQLAVKGHQTLLAPEVSVRHLGQTSTEAVGLFAVEQFFRSQIITYRRWSGVSGAVMGASALAATLILLLISEPARRLVRYRPLESGSWCRAALRGIWQGLRCKAVSPPSKNVSSNAWPLARRISSHSN